AAGFLERDGGRRLDALGEEANLAELCRARHREAPAVRGRQQLLGGGALAVLEARAERILAVGQHAAVGRKRAFACLEVAIPHGGCAAVHGVLASSWAHERDPPAPCCNVISSS